MIYNFSNAMVPMNYDLLPICCEANKFSMPAPAQCSTEVRHITYQFSPDQISNSKAVPNNDLLFLSSSHILPPHHSCPFISAHLLVDHENRNIDLPDHASCDFGDRYAAHLW